MPSLNRFYRTGEHAEHGGAEQVLGLVDDLDGDACGLCDAVGIIGGIGEDPFDEGKAAAGCLQQRDGAIAVLDLGRMTLQDQGATIGVDHGVALAAVDLLARVVTTRTTGFGGFLRFGCRSPRPRGWLRAQPVPG